MRRARVLLLAPALLALACASLRPAAIPDSSQQPIRFLSYRVVHRGLDHLALEIQYSYDGSHGDGVFLGAISTRAGRSTGFWGYRPDALLPGTHWARVRLGLSSTAPLVHRTDGIELSMYEGGGSSFHEVSVPFTKTWFRVPEKLQGHKQWGAGCGG
jgi:hypothetical protein